MTALSDDVVVTGLGATTPLGGDVATFWAGLLEGRSGVVALSDDWAAGLKVRIAAPMAVDPAEVLSRVRARRLDRAQQAAIVAAREAWADAGFTGTSDENGLEPERVAVVIGTGIGGVTSLIYQHDVMLAKARAGSRRCSSRWTCPTAPRRTSASRSGRAPGCSRRSVPARPVPRRSPTGST